MATTKKTGTFKGKSNSLGQGGRAAQLKAQGVPGGVIGMIARSKGAAPGQKNFHRKAKRAVASPNTANHTAFMGNGGYKPNNTQGVGGMSIPKRAAKKSVKKRGIGNAVAKVTGWPGGLNNVSLNKAGTVGTEPISKGNNKFTELKAGGLGKFDIPMGTLKRKRSMPQRRNHRSMTGEQMLGKGMRKMAS